MILYTLGLKQEIKEKLQIEKLKEINRNSQIFLIKINDLIDFSQINTPNLKLCTTQFSLSYYVNEVLDLFKSQANAHNINLEVFYNSIYPTS